jgi:phytoene synthase
VATAAALYAEILDCIEKSEFAVFDRRATVGKARRLRVAGAGLIRSWRARNGERDDVNSGAA